MESDFEILHLEKQPWEPFGSNTKNIFRKSLSFTKFSSGFRASLTLAKPDGEFPEHVDPYSHIFYILEGEGEAVMEGNVYPFKKGDAFTVMAGKKHGYRNNGQEDLLLITLNIYER
ncbi:MAG: cupin domain-containing protein [Thermodesulfobacteriota bacterium]